MDIELKAKRFKLKNIITFIKKNYFLIIFAGCIGFVGVVAFYKLFISKPTYVYAKVKVGQGLWWATTQRPSLWCVRAIEQANEQKELTGKTLAKILNVTYYPYYGSGQYETYITAQLKVSKVGGTGTYNFNRETIGVSSSIDLEFSNVQFSGTIIDLSETPIKDSYVEKTIYLTKKYSYPWEYDQIQLGDSLSNGKKKIFEVVDKAKGDTNEMFFNDLGKLVSTESETYRYIIIKAKVQVKNIDGQYIFGEEYVLSSGRSIPVVTNNLTLNDYTISKIE